MIYYNKKGGEVPFEIFKLGHPLRRRTFPIALKE